MNPDHAVLLSALHADPADETTWLALADVLEESGQPQRAELTRLLRCVRTLADGDERVQAEGRVQGLLAAGVPPCVPVLTNTVGMAFALIATGTFQMGSPESETDRNDDEGPQHEVEITRPFYLGVHPVTQRQYEQVMGVNPSHFQSVAGEDAREFPVEDVSWKEAVQFCKKLTTVEKRRGRGRVYRLPSEAEWEYACRGGLSSSHAFHFGNTLSSTQANFDGNDPYGDAAKGPYLNQPCKVGSYMPNGYGLYDMHGNVWEWCADWYDKAYYGTSPRCDPPGPPKGSGRVFRGGSWSIPGKCCRSAIRFVYTPGYRSLDLGFRVALAASSEEKQGKQRRSPE